MGKTFIFNEHLYNFLKEVSYQCGYPHTDSNRLSTRLYRIFDACKADSGGNYVISNLSPIEEECLLNDLDGMDPSGRVQDDFYKDDPPLIYRILE